MRHIHEFNTTAELEAFISDAPDGTYILKDNSVSTNKVRFVTKPSIDRNDPFYIIFNVDSTTITSNLSVNPGTSQSGVTHATFQYSYDKVTWYNMASTISVPGRTRIYIRNSQDNDTSWVNHNNLTVKSLFNMTAERHITIGGRLDSLFGKVPGKIKDAFGLFKRTANPDVVYYIDDVSALIMPGGGSAESMFEGRTELPNCPQFPASVDSTTSYKCMFKNCTNLYKSPKLPSPTVYASMYESMFSGCTHLETIDTISATSIGNSGCSHMFEGCTRLLTSVDLSNVTSMGNNAFEGMFYGCTGLSFPLPLPPTTTTLSQYCYYSMFTGCTNLAYAPDLPHTTLNTYCYYYMFSGCTSLTSAPVLPATSIQGLTRCYSGMFYNCSSLSEITLEAQGTGDAAFVDWVHGVASTGTFYNNGNISLSTGDSGIPTGWEEVKPFTGEPFWIRPYNSANVVIRGSNAGWQYSPLMWSKDKVNWTTFTDGQGCSVRANAGEKVYFKCASATNDRWYTNWDRMTACPIRVQDDGDSESFDVGGYLSSLYKGIGWERNDVGFSCHGLLSNDDDERLFYANELVLPPLTMDHQFGAMFESCNQLMYPPVLTATTLLAGCYWAMFRKCANLKEMTSYASDISASNCLGNWVLNAGTVYRVTFHNLGRATYTRDYNGVPASWNLVTT